MPKSGMQWFVRSVTLSWGATIAAAIANVLGNRWLGTHWDTFDVIVIPPLFLAQFVAGVLMLFAAFRMMKDAKTLIRRILAFLLCVSTVALSFLFFAVVGLWVHFDVLHRSS